MPDNRAELPLGERLRKIAADDRRLAENANEYFHRHQESAGWYNAVIKGEYEDRSDYAPTLERCALLEEAANALDGVKQSKCAVEESGRLKKSSTIEQSSTLSEALMDRLIKKFHEDSTDAIRKRPAYKIVDGKLIREAWGDYINVCHLHKIVDDLLNIRLDALHSDDSAS